MKKILSFVFGLVLVLSLMPIQHVAADENDAIVLDVSKASVIISNGADGTLIHITGASKTGTAIDQDYSVSTVIEIMQTDTITSNTIQVNTKKDTSIILSGVKIITSNCAFRIGGQAGKVTVTLADSSVNTLKSGDGYAGLQKDTDKVLTITGTDGVLSAFGGDSGAGIGGGDGQQCKSVTIEGGIINATAGQTAAAIGGGCSGWGHDITINGGTVNAIGSSDSGIGSGIMGNGSGSIIVINGGSVKTTGFDDQVIPVSSTGVTGTSVFLTKVQILDGSDIVKNAAVSQLVCNRNGNKYSYSTKGMYTDDEGYLYLYLPEDTSTCGAVVTASSSTESDDYTYPAGIITNDQKPSGILSKARVTIQYVAEEGGSLQNASETMKPISTMQASGSTVTASAGNHFVKWTNALGESVSTNAAFVPVKGLNGLYASATYTAHFALDPVPETVTLTISTQGDVVISGGGTYEQGSPVTLIAPEKEGFSFTGWYEDGKQISTEKTYSIAALNGDRTIEARYQEDIVSHTVTVTVTPKEGGTVDGDGTYEQGSSVTLSETEKEGYSFIGWYEDDIQIGTEKTYTISSVNEERTIEAMFKADSNNISETAVDSIAPDTSDSNTLMIWMIVFMIGCVSAVLVVQYQRSIHKK